MEVQRPIFEALAFSIKPSYTTIEFKSNNTLDISNRDILKAYIGDRRGISNILIYIKLKTTLRIKELDILTTAKNIGYSKR